MKNIIIFIFTLICFNSWACQNFISEQGASVAINNAQNDLNDPLPQDWNKGSLCFDNIEWGAAEIVDNVVDDLTKPIKRKFQVIGCQKVCEEVKPDDIVEALETCILCEDALIDLNCEEKYIDENYTQAYCVELQGYEKKIDGKKLINSEVKLVQLTEKRKQKEQSEKQKEEIEKRKKEAQDVFFDELIRENNGQFITAQEIRQLVKESVKIKKENARIKE